MAVRERLAGAVDAHLPDMSAPRSLDRIPKAPPTQPVRWLEIGLAGEMLPDGLHPLSNPHDLAADLCIVHVPLIGSLGSQGRHKTLQHNALLSEHRDRCCVL